MRNLTKHVIFILVVVVAIASAIFPPDTQLRKAKDLAGGASLTYQVELRPTDPQDTINKVIDLLRKRVDPDGVLDISMVKQGANRIEISMPLPSEKVKEARRKYEDAVKSLAEGAVTQDALRRVMNRPTGERDAELDRLAGGDKPRRELLGEAARLFDLSISLRREFNERQRPALEAAITQATTELSQAQTNNKPAEEIAALQKQVQDAQQALLDAARPSAQADLDYDAAETRALATAISAADVQRAMELSGKGRTFLEADGKTKVTLKSPRERAIDRLKESHPSAAARLDEVVRIYNDYTAGRKTLDDPADLARLLRGAGVLSFRITPRVGEVPEERRLRDELRAGGPRAVRSETLRWYKVYKPEGWLNKQSTTADARLLAENPQTFFAQRGGYIVEEYDGQPYMLALDVPGSRLTGAEGSWRVSKAYITQDQIGSPAIGFEMDTLGGVRMGELTGANNGKMMAVLLDDEVYTAPNIQSTITTRGQITGGYTRDEIDRIVQTLNAGSLAAKLSPEPISVSSIGPQLGADNLARGFQAGVLALVIVAGFMIVYYFGCGLVSVLALLINAVLILGLMAANRAAFSLPGIAGLVLTFGMAVDANVLIYERLREEMERGSDFRQGLRLGYSRAMSSIIDGNMTTLIVCAVLALFGTPEIRGFGIVMIIGGLTTLFTQLYITRVMFVAAVDRARMDKLGTFFRSVLAYSVPAISRALHPHIDWMRGRLVMLGISGVFVAASLFTVYTRGVDLLENDFRGGTKVTFELKKDSSGKPQTLTRAQVEGRIRTAAQELADQGRGSLNGFEFSTLVVNPVAGDATRSAEFTIKTVVTDTPAVQEAVTRAMLDVLDVQPAVKFAGSDSPDPRVAPIRPVLSPILGESIDRAGLKKPVPEFIGGAAIVVENLTPRPTLASLNERLAQMRNSPEYQRALLRPHQWVVVDGDESAVATAVLLVRDDAVNYLADQNRWNNEVRAVEWKLVTEALSRQSSLSSVESFSSAIASTFQAQALLSVMVSAILITVYIWVRFQSFRYSLGALASTVHDCIVAVGALAMCKYILDHAPGLGHALGLEPFKIDLNVVAAVLTILGYSLNDTVIVMDRIRELRGKAPVATRQMVNDAINQTVSRTIITSGCTLVATLCLYMFGGEAMRPFAFTFLVGVITGTYSSIFIAAPIVYDHRTDPTGGRYERRRGVEHDGELSPALSNGQRSATLAP